uniref:right-handed parallel beta-helix repeat-containing protein n=1 Tax=Novipirellula sp. TaxID=2795430 RepID=UPI00356A7CAD
MNLQKKLNVMKLATTTLLIILATAQTTLAADLFVSMSGNDTQPGTKELPVATLQKAKTLAASYAGNEAVTVHVSDGIYYLPEPLVFTPEDSGTKDKRVVYRSEHEGGAVLSGGTKLALQWQPYRDGIFQAVTPADLAIDQLFINGSSQRMARYPNYDANKPTDAYQGFAADAFSKERAARWKNPEGGFIHAMHRSRWGGYHYRITGKDADGEVTYEGGWQNNRQMGMHKDFRMVENIFEELDAAGEWFHDAEANTLYYKPDADTDLNTATVEVVRLRHLVEFQGTLDAPVKSITFQGFVFRHAARTFMDTKEPMLRSDWTIYRGGAVMITGSEDIHILDSEFDQVGGNAIFVNQYNRGTLVKGCHIHDCGASGVCFVGDPAAVRDPLFEYGQKNDLAKIDRTPGPKTENYPANGTVEDCLIHGIGRVERQPAGVQIEMAMAITVRDCSIYDCARAGINVGDGAWGGHLIERCDVFDTVLETHDHGSFNSWGRDRYWRRDYLDVSQKAIDADPKLPFLDAFNTTVIRNSRWRCDHGWDIDLDDGSSNYDIYNNLMLQGGLKLREGFRRRAWNNITINNGFHPHVWFNNSQDEVFSNIFMAAHLGARMPSQKAKGKRIDSNLFFSADPKMKDKFVQFGWDLHSIVADP